MRQQDIGTLSQIRPVPEFERAAIEVNAARHREHAFAIRTSIMAGLGSRAEAAVRDVEIRQGRRIRR